MLERSRGSRILELLSESSPETQKKTQAIQEGIGKLPEVSAAKELLGGLAPNEVYEGNGKNESHFRASLVNISGTKILKVDIWGDEGGRASIVVDFSLALRRLCDARANAHDKDLLDSDDRLFWKM